MCLDAVRIQLRDFGKISGWMEEGKVTMASSVEKHLVCSRSLTSEPNTSYFECNCAFTQRSIQKCSVPLAHSTPSKSDGGTMDTLCALRTPYW